jgi:hypothetical protein
LQQTVPFTTAVPPPPRVSVTGKVERPRHLQLAAFIAALAWYFCAKALAASAASGLTGRFEFGEFRPLLQGLFQVFLVAVGVAMLAAIERRRAPLRITMGLPRRRSALTEWAEGAAIGWGGAIACVFPLLLFGALNVRFWTAPRAWGLAAINLLSLALFSLALALGVYGYGLQRLIEAAGPTRATLVISLLAVLYVGLNPNYGGLTAVRVTVAFIAAVLLCICWIRTHGLWLLWGMYFAWSAAVGVLFGLPLTGSSDYSSLVETRALGPVWLTGGDLGPAAGIATVVCVLAALVIVVRLTNDYAWNYTRPAIIPAGIAVEIPPPAAHDAMQTAAPPPPPLVQILPTTPAGPDGGTSSE